MLMVLFYLIAFALFVYVMWYVLNLIPLPQPLRVVITVLFVLVCLLVLVNYMPLDLPRGRLFR